MDHLNAEARQNLAEELVKMKFNQAKWKLLKMDASGRIKFFRNTQRVGFLMTQFVLPTYGVRVTLHEVHSSNVDPISSKISGDNRLAEVEVEPLSENKV